jgi:hypothetical protein
MTLDEPVRAVTSPGARVVAEKIADCPFSLSLDVTPTIFPMLENPVDGVRLPIAFLKLPFSPVLSRSVNVRFKRQPDRTEPGRAHDEFEFDWNAHALATGFSRCPEIASRLIENAHHHDGFLHSAIRPAGRHLRSLRRPRYGRCDRARYRKPVGWMLGKTLGCRTAIFSR